MGVDQIDVLEGDRARCRDVAGRVDVDVLASTPPPWSCPTSIVGASLVPVMVTVTSWVTVPPWPSDNDDRVDLGDGLVHCQGLQDRIVFVEREGPVDRANVVRIGVVLVDRRTSANLPI